MIPGMPVGKAARKPCASILIVRTQSSRLLMFAFLHSMLINARKTGRDIRVEKCTIVHTHTHTHTHLHICKAFKHARKHTLLTPYLRVPPPHTAALSSAGSACLAPATPLGSRSPHTRSRSSHAGSTCLRAFGEGGGRHVLCIKVCVRLWVSGCIVCVCMYLCVCVCVCMCVCACLRVHVPTQVHVCVCKSWERVHGYFCTEFAYKCMRHYCMDVSAQHAVLLCLPNKRAVRTQVRTCFWPEWAVTV